MSHYDDDEEQSLVTPTAASSCPVKGNSNLPARVIILLSYVRAGILDTSMEGYVDHM